MKRKNDNNLFNRRNFIKVTGIGLGSGILALNNINCTGEKKVVQPVIQGFETSPAGEDISKGWVPFSDRKIRVGIVGYGVCKFGAAFGFQDHPNVDVVAVSDLFPDRCAELAKACRCNKTYPSLEELVKDDSIEAVFVATDAPGHKKHCIEVLKHGKHVASAVPAVFGSLGEAEELFEVVRQSGLKYMMFETSYFRENLYAMRRIYKAGGFGKIIYAEGEYWHYSEKGIDSFNNWRHGMPPQWYPTHSDAYYVGVTDNSFTEVSCLGVPSSMERYQKGNNRYNNPFGTEISFYKTSDGGMARMSRSSDTIGHGYGSETGRVRGLKGSYYDKYEGLEKDLPDLSRPPLPPGMNPGGHGGSHGYLTDEFVRAIIEDRKPLVDIAAALNMTVGGIVAHQSALRDGEWMKIPQFKL
jgi:predicted dehydrogenase